MKNKFNIGETVYHITPGSPRGIIMDVREWKGDGSYDYLIVWTYVEKSFCDEKEISYKQTT